MSISASAAHLSAVRLSNPPMLVEWIIDNWLITDPALVENPKKNFQTHGRHQINHVYLCGGRVKATKQRPVNVFVGVCMLAGGVLFWVFEASWLWHHISPAVVIVTSYLWLLAFLFFVKASSCDPGIAPRNIHFPLLLDSPHKPPQEYFNTVLLPYAADKHRGVLVKYCATCHIWRSPRMSHCGVCNTCVAVHDHHCLFLNNCVGFRNYRYFLWFLLCTLVLAVLIAVLAFVHVFHYRWSRLYRNFHDSAAAYPVALFLAIFGLISFVYPAMLLVFHIYLSANNLTTREYLNLVRPTRHNAPEDKYHNVYRTQSIWRNLYLLWVAMPQGVSLSAPRLRYIPGDVRFEKIAALEME